MPPQTCQPGGSPSPLIVSYTATPVFGFGDVRDVGDNAVAAAAELRLDRLLPRRLGDECAATAPGSAPHRLRVAARTRRLHERRTADGAHGVGRRREDHAVAAVARRRGDRDARIAKVRVLVALLAVVFAAAPAIGDGDRLKRLRDQRRGVEVAVGLDDEDPAMRAVCRDHVDVRATAPRATRRWSAAGATACLPD